MALLEAMAAGLPVIATAVSGTRDVVAGSESGGILVTAGDVEELCGALDRLASDAALRRSLGRAARRRVADHFSVGVQARAHADLYRALMHAQPLAQPGVLP
jgi:glycosyltransferase involved in cell wall biosynthesis